MNVISQFPAAHDYERDLRLQAMFDAAAIGIGICRLDGGMVDANPALGRMLGYSPQELIGAHGDELLREDKAETDRLKSSQGPSRELHAVDFPRAGNLLGELVRGERAAFEIDKRCRRKDGSEFWGRLTVSLGLDARRQPAFLIVVLTDATGQRRAEELLREAEKMQAIGRLAGSIAHDFNNLLTGILLYCDLLSAGLDEGRRNSATAKRGLTALEMEDFAAKANELYQHVEEVRMAGEHGTALTRQLLAIARKQTAEPSPVRVNEIMAITENLLRRLMGEQIELAVVLDPALDFGAGVVLADPAQLRQIVLNLALNARDAMPQGGKIVVTTRAAEFPGSEPGDTELRAAKPFGTESQVRGGPGEVRHAALLSVKDSGCGMDGETCARLFEPFFTTKNPGMGTGLGLATVQRIVGELGGMIKVESHPGQGTTIEVFLPIADIPHVEDRVSKDCES